MAAVVHRLRQRHAHETRGRERAIEPRQLHHLDDGAHARALVADAQGVRAGELDLARSVRAVAELVLEPLQAERIERAVGPKARHEEAGQPDRRLAPAPGRRRTSARTETICGRRWRRNRRPRWRVVMLARTSVPPCFSVMPMPSVMPGFSHHGRNSGIVAPRDHLRRHLCQQRRIGRERRQRRTRHGDGAQMPALDLGGHVIAGGARDFGRRRGARAGRGPGRALQAGGDAGAHQIVIGRMEFDHVAAEAFRIEGVELRRILVGAAGGREHFGRAPLPSERRQRHRLVTGAVACTASCSGRSLE